METIWIRCETLDGVWWYEDPQRGIRLPPGVQPIMNLKELLKGNEIKTPKIDPSKIRRFGKEK